MTTQKDFTELARLNQEAFTSFVQNWLDATRDYALTWTMLPGGTPSPSEAVEKAFDFTEQVLRAQREFVTRLVATTSDATEAAYAVAEDAWKTAEESVDDLRAASRETAGKTSANGAKVNAAAE